MAQSFAGVTGIGVDDFERIAEEFGRDLLRNHYSPATVRIYKWSYNGLIRHARASTRIINRDSLERWQDKLLTDINPRSFALAGVGVRRLLHWAADQGYCDRELVHAVPTGKYERLKIPHILTPNTVLRLEHHLLTQPKTFPPNIRELRDRALFFYVKGTAASMSEILQVRRDEFQMAVVRQKGGHRRALAPPDGVALLIRDYLAARTDDVPWLWIALKTSGVISKLQDDGVSKIWTRLARKVGVQRFTTRELRATAATLLVQKGHDLNVVMDFLGVRDIRSVQGYKQLVADRLARVRADLDVLY